MCEIYHNEPRIPTLNIFPFWKKYFISLFFSYLMLKYVVNELYKNQFFKLLSEIPYENVTKILRLPLSEEERLRTARNVLEGFKKMGTGGTCFSLVNLSREILSMDNIHIFPAMAKIQRDSFPHFFCILEVDNEMYLLDPGYLITAPVHIDPEKTIYFDNSVMTFKLSPKDGVYTLYSTKGSQNKERYQFEIKPVSLSSFNEKWTQSYSYMNAVTASRIINKRFIYICGNYVQIQEAGNVHKYRNIKKAYAYLEEYFGFTPDQVKEAEQLLKKYNTK